MMKFNQKKIILVGVILALGILLLLAWNLQEDLVKAYQHLESKKIIDRQGKEIAILPNEKGNFSSYLKETPSRFEELLIKKEDRYFYYHFGFNPVSIIQSAFGYLGLGERRASSTISQQLVKILLGKEFERNLKNKIIEAFYTLSLELYKSKEEILTMYINSIYFGNKAQGLAEASQFYFSLSPKLLTDGQILQLISSIQNPSKTNPAELTNKETALTLAKRLNLANQELGITNFDEIKENVENYSHFSDSYFEVQSLIKNFSEENQFTSLATSTQTLTLDKELNEKIRKIVQRNIEELASKDVKQGAVIVIKLPENEILAMIGSPDPASFEEGNQINMLLEPRPIGSTVKPFIYLKAFEKGLRPYTLVDDREYKYMTALGFPLYPKNFDYQYRGEVNLHYALSNSLNVPSVKVLEYVGLENFYKFLEKDLEFQPIQSLDNYQLGIALGDLEMSLWDLSKYFTIFPNEGVLREPKIYLNETKQSEKMIAKAQYVQLINKIINDRKTGIEQFGLKSELNLSQENYALKTGTSRDFHDSWIIGFTPDFLVGVWVGNADNTPTEAVSGQTGAGQIWSEVMELLFYSKYNKKTPFNFSFVKEFNQERNIEYGLSGDDYEKALNALKERDLSLILSPHSGDVFILEKNTRIILEAKEKVNWYIDKKFLGYSQNQIFVPEKAGQYQIRAENSSGNQETIIIFIQGAD